LSTRRLLGRVAAGAALSAVAYGIAFVLLFLYGSASIVLLWAPPLLAVLAAGAVLLRPVHERPGRLAAPIAALLLAGAWLGTGAWLAGVGAAKVTATTTPGMAADGDVVTASGGTIHFHQSATAASDSPVLLVLHGGPGSGSVGARAALETRLAPSLRTVFLDQRGVGRSSPAPSSYRLEDYLDDIERLRVALDIDSWYLFGISWGAALADEYAAQHPDRVRGVVTWGGLVANQAMTRSMAFELHAFYDARGDARGVDWARALEDQDEPYSRLQTVRIVNAVNRLRLKTVPSRDEEVATVLAARDLAVREWGYAPGRTGTSLWATLATFVDASLEDYDFRPRLPQIRAPYLFLMGERDPLLSHVPVDEYAAGMPDATVRRVTGAGHTLDRPDAIAAEVVAFVRSLASDRPGSPVAAR